MSVTFRAAGPDDADAVARLHADSWRRFYRGAFADHFLDGDVVEDRIAVWTSRLATPDGTATVLAEDADGLAGFVHILMDHDATWGSLLDNLHVSQTRQRSGIGSALITRGAAAVVDHATTPAMYLWVLEQNTKAQAFYRSHGGELVGREPVTSVSPDRLTGTPYGLRCVWPDTVTLAARS